ncbi:uncharacterized protein DNG_08619 [Cephalotrichum gorgonifer]|uniref:Nephrocystin 3-like N-terminal domain-containing protein n=1 Tax=Cephalotrichum gorgonifer TaxID=2041049 RepID=A0AAE8N441_9PEZI|nr:uncharacterized protein DNG_08619 [Cephalotrichum gorgonifer]
MAPVTIAKPGRPVRTVSQAEPILSNIAAEFVEVKAGREICRRATGSLVEDADGKDVANNIVDIGDGEDSDQEQGRVSPKFVSALDCFVPERKMFKDANIEYRDPANYDLTYVLKIAESIREHEEGLANTQRVKGFVRKFLRRLLEQNPVSAMPSMAIKRTGSIIPIEQMAELANTWLSRLGEFDPLSERHISECMSGVSKLSPEEKDQVQWLMAEDALTDWLRLTDSRLLSIQAESAPVNLFNAMSFTAATLAFTLGTTTDYAVLSFFCGLRTNDSRDIADSGPKAVLKSLNGQLLSFITSKRQTADLSFLEGKKLMKKSRKTWEYAMKLFRKLLGALPDGDVVFVILDSFSRLVGTGRDAEKGNELIEELHALTKKMPLVIKVLVTDALPKCPVKKLADKTIYVLDDVDGWKNDFSTSMLEEKKKAVIDEFRDRLAKGDLNSEEEDSDSSLDSLPW